MNECTLNNMFVRIPSVQFSYCTEFCENMNIYLIQKSRDATVIVVNLM